MCKFEFSKVVSASFISTYKNPNISYTFAHTKYKITKWNIKENMNILWKTSLQVCSFHKSYLQAKSPYIFWPIYISFTLAHTFKNCKIKSYRKIWTSCLYSSSGTKFNIQNLRGEDLKIVATLSKSSLNCKLTHFHKDNDKLVLIQYFHRCNRSTYFAKPSEWPQSFQYWCQNL